VYIFNEEIFLSVMVKSCQRKTGSMRIYRVEMRRPFFRHERVFLKLLSSEEFLQHASAAPGASVFLVARAVVLSMAHAPVLFPVPFEAIHPVRVPFPVLSPALSPAPALPPVYPSGLI
jgi:hypothetical protein